MASVFMLLSLPKTTNAFTAINPTVVELDNGQTSPRKTRRLETDSDSPSAPRSLAKQWNDPIRIQITGDQFDEPSEDDGSFALVRRCLRILLTKDIEEELPCPYEDIYAGCRSVVTVANKGEGLYGSLKIELEQSVGRLANDLIATPEKGMRWIVEFVNVCQWFELHISLLQSLMTYLDQVYVASNRDVINTRTLAFSLFTERIFENPRIAQHLREGIYEWVSWERKFRLEHDFRVQVSILLGYLIAHKQYSAFEEYFIEITQAFYLAESEERRATLSTDPKAFFKHVSLRIEEENLRSKAVLPVGSWSLVREVTEEALWEGRLEWIATQTVGPYMDSKDTSTLATMYNLFERVHGIKTLCNAFRMHVQTTVQDIVTDKAKDDLMVQRLLDFKALADNTISLSFVKEKTVTTRGPTGTPSTSEQTKQPNIDFVYAVRDAFTTGFKARRSTPAEMIAKYLDKAMRQGQGATSDESFEALLDSVLSLYRFTDDKDVFRSFYHRSLAKRLLLQKSASDDFEASMLKKLKEQYDPEFGMGEDMFKDLALSREMVHDYHSKLPQASSGRKLSVMVLQRSAWPFNVQKTTIDLPPIMQADLTEYANYYKQRHSGHVLDWDHALGTVTMTAQFNAAPKELSVSLYQAVVLLLFNGPTEWRYPDILEQTNMEDAELRRTLQSLACGKKKVLKKVPPGKDVADGDVFRYNPDFEDPRAKVHINSIQAKVSPEESKRTNESIEGDRKHYLDAAIVRIMKAKKEMTYEQLKAATIEAVKSHFVPQVDAIKKRIDSLVETDYLERSKEDRSKFLYVA